MKTPAFAFVLSLSVVIAVRGQDVQQNHPPAYQVGEKGADYRTWQRVDYSTNELGQAVPVTNNVYAELATGMNYQKDAQWLETKEEIDPVPGGGAATNGQYQVYFPIDINSGTIRLVTTDGQQLQSHPWGIAYFDGNSSVLLATLTNSTGLIVSPGNQVIYTNAFDGLSADLVCTYRKSGFECDLVLHEQPLEPELYDLNPATTRLQLLTEFFNTAAPMEDAQTTFNGLPDSTLKFGAMRMVRGKAFLVDGQNAEVPVNKSWQILEARTFLVEEVPLNAIAAQLATLPQHAASIGKPYRSSRRQEALISPGKRPKPSVASQKLPAGDSRTKPSALRMPMAQASPPRKGFVLDYNLVSSASDVTFRGDTTYYVSGTVNLTGTTTIEGGAVIKFTNSTSAELSIGTLVCQTAFYRPAILTSKNDDTIGETISGSTGSPANTSGGTYIYSTANNTYKHLRFSYAGIALQSDNTDSEVWHSQFVQCGTGVYDSTAQKNLNLRNVLFTQCTVATSNATVKAEHVTADQVAVFSSASGPILTNSLLTAVTNIGSSPGLYNCATNASGTGFYQTLAAGNYYLAADSTNRNAGTTNIFSTLLADVEKMTTYPPLFLSTTVSVDTTLAPQCQRDTDVPDLGFHYDPVDYVTWWYAFSNATLTVASGTAIASYNDSGIWIADGSSITSIGTPLVPNWFTRYSAVQEQSIALGPGPAFGTSINPYHAGPAGSNAVFRFSKFSCPAGGGYLMYHSAQFTYASLLVQDCEFWSGQNLLPGGTNTSANVINNLFARSRLSINGSFSSNAFLTLSNNTVFGLSTAITLTQPSGVAWYAFNNAFDTCTIFPTARCTNGNNAYVNCVNRILPTSASDVVTATPVGWQSGPLGDFYQPTNSLLIDVGNTTADLVGLYHYTTATNQVKETNTVVDIGYHYVAVTNGVPFDTDGDGMPDYLEDANGNGSVDSGETDWQSASDLGLKVIITRPRAGSSIP